MGAYEEQGSSVESSLVVRDDALRMPWCVYPLEVVIKSKVIQEKLCESSPRDELSLERGCVRLVFGHYYTIDRSLPAT